MTTHPITDQHARFAVIAKQVNVNQFNPADGPAIIDTINSLTSIPPAQTAQIRNVVECAWLRSTGVPALAQHHREHVKDDALRAFRNRVLDAADSYVEGQTGACKAGWKDEDLETLFKGVDAHFEARIWPAVGGKLIAAEIARRAESEGASAIVA